MTRRQEKALIEALDDIYSEVHENNVMLHQLCQVVNIYLSKYHQENEDDFNRNVLANLVSNIFDGKQRRR